MEKINRVQIPMTLDEPMLNKINAFIEEHKNIYSSRSHFLRCCVIYLMNNKEFEK